MLNNLQALNIQKGGPVNGVFRLREPVLCRTRAGDAYLRLRLEDMSGSIRAYAWQEEVYQDTRVTDLGCVYVEGQVRQRSDEAIIDLLALKATAKPEKAVRLIPQSICPQPWLLSFLDAAVSRFTNRPLLQFVESVLSDDSIAFAFVSAPASLNHHHNYPGGLLAHSLECFQMIEKHNEFPRNQLELGLASALFHDVGKILTITHKMKRTSLGHNIDHDKLTLEVLGPHLKKLDHEWPEGGGTLRYLLTWKKGQRIPKYDMADLVSCCDRLSAGFGFKQGSNL